MQVVFHIHRQGPDSLAQIQSYELEIEPGKTILDGLNQIKWEQDGSLAFRKNCRNTICGSCAIRVNGRSVLACKENIGREVARSQLDSTADSPELTIAPMGNFPVIKDLVVDMQDFWSTLKAVDPYVSTAARSVSEREFLQTPEERAKLDQTGNCILCGACYSECNARAVNPSFVGPHALAKAYRMVADSRDTDTANRLERYHQGTEGVWGCTRCYACNAVCPMDVAPMEQISRIKQDILARPETSPSRSLRHRKTLIELVKQGGWIDERQFGLQVMGNGFKDVSGLLGLVPLGLRMMRSRKFPLGFEPSQDVSTIRSLIESVQAFEAESRAAVSAKEVSAKENEENSDV
jgi:succinate dehydrogenase / fumarate reductase, iron-sulfur subunit